MARKKEGSTGAMTIPFGAEAEAVAEVARLSGAIGAWSRGYKLVTLYAYRAAIGFGGPATVSAEPVRACMKPLSVDASDAGVLGLRDSADAAE